MFAAINSFLTRAVSGYFLNKSLRFRSSASAYLNRTPATAGNRTVWTWSAWVKRGSLGSIQYLFYAGATGADASDIGFNSSDQLIVENYVGGVYKTNKVTNALFRDPAAWYHVFISQNGATACDVYVNGVVQTFATSVGPDATNWYINNTQLHDICKRTDVSSGYFDGELAEINFVDGQALAPTAFGAYSTYNQWLPIKYAGTYGTNGFYLPFNSVSTSSYAGSFNGSNQYLSMPLNAVLTLGSGDFTVEAWIIKSTSGAGEVFGKTGTVNYAIDCQTIAGNYAHITLSSNGTTTTNIAGATALATNTWYHVAWVRSGTTINIYLNGVLDGTGTFSGAIYSGSNVDVSGIGARPGSGIAPDTWFNGYISNLRVVKGTAVYTAAFTPPVAPLTAITNTSLLTLQSATVVDNSGNSVSITNNNTIVTSVQYPFTLAIAADSSGNGNNWTPNNISLTAGSTYDSLTDVPTLTSETVANYAVLNPLQKGGSVNPSSGNLQYLNTATAYFKVFSTIGITSGKWYVEYVIVASSAITNGRTTAGLARYDVSTSNYYGSDTYSWGSINTPGNNVYNSNTAKAITTGAFVAGDVLMLAYDADAGKLWFGVKGAWDNGNDPSTGSTPSYSTNLLGSTGPFFFGVHGYTSPDNIAINFGQQPFAYTPPTGFLPLNTFNI